MVGVDNGKSFVAFGRRNWEDSVLFAGLEHFLLVDVEHGNMERARPSNLKSF